MNVGLLKAGFFAGLLATAAMDVVAAIGRQLGVVSGPPPPLGRWLGYMLRGRLVHSDIDNAAPLPFEVPLTLIGHYSIGGILGVGFVAILQRALVAGSPVATAITYGMSTSILAWFVMFPAMGYGWFGLRGSPTRNLFRTSVINHLTYGVALGFWTLL